LENDILVIDSLTGHFDSGAGSVRVLQDVNFSLARGTITGLVGETGSGKSLTAHLVLRIQPQAFVRDEGRIMFEGEDIFGMNEIALRQMRGSRISIVFQDARGALNPVFPVGRQLADVCRLHRDVSRRDAKNIVVDALRRVHIPEPERRAGQYPHQFSGGMAQRVMIAMALICEPEVLILDEPTTGLDVTTQAAILDLIAELTAEVGLTTLLITHDLGVVAETCQNVVVMQEGRVRELGTSQEIFTAPKDNYTRRLLAASRLVAEDDMAESA
jgi:ABC-type glutathione transport system ATPase component